MTREEFEALVGDPAYIKRLEHAVVRYVPFDETVQARFDAAAVAVSRALVYYATHDRYTSIPGGENPESARRRFTFIVQKAKWLAWEKRGKRTMNSKPRPIAPAPADIFSGPYGRNPMRDHFADRYHGVDWPKLSAKTGETEGALKMRELRYLRRLATKTGRTLTPKTLSDLAREKQAQRRRHQAAMADPTPLSPDAAARDAAARARCGLPPRNH